MMTSTTNTTTVTPQGKMVTGLFEDRASAERAYESLSGRGYTKDDVNLVMSDETRKTHFGTGVQTELGTKAAEGAGVGGAIGGTVGAVLAAIAAVLRETVRRGDELCRWGGEEMLLLLPETNLAEALGLAERIRAAVEAMPIPITEREGGQPLLLGARDEHDRHVSAPPTVSIGVATIYDSTAPLADAVARADQALYRAKRSGRNQVQAATNTAR